jgi:flagellar biosynthesis protein FlhG
MEHLDPDGWDDDYVEAPDELRGARHLVVVGGGRGGVGKSLLAQNLAVYFAQLGKRVVLVDADATGANLHTQFGVRAAARDPNVDEDPHGSFENALVETLVPGLWLLPAAHDSIKVPFALRAARKARWLSRLRALPCDYLVVDAGPGHGPLALDLLLAADVPICVTVPEPPAVETTYRVFRAAFLRKVRRSLGRDRFKLGLLDRYLEEEGRIPTPLSLSRTIAKSDKNLAELVWAEACRIHMYLVVNQTRVRSDTELGSWMQELTRKHFGLHVEELGHVEHDDTAWLAVRRGRPLLVDSPASKAARNVERVARRVVAVTAVRPTLGQAPPPLPGDAPTLYEALGLSRSAIDEEIRRAYKRQKEIYQDDSVAIASLFLEGELRREQSRLDESYDTLLDPVRRRAYDLSTFPDEENRSLSEISVRPALAAEQLLLQKELEREIGLDTEFSGELLRRIRESRGIELAEIAQITKIGRAHLLAIEDENEHALPATVYARGFLVELAKFLRLDPTRVQKTYLRRLARKMDNDG